MPAVVVPIRRPSADRVAAGYARQLATWLVCILDRVEPPAAIFQAGAHLEHMHGITLATFPGLADVRRVWLEARHAHAAGELNSDHVAACLGVLDRFDIDPTAWGPRAA